MGLPHFGHFNLTSFRRPHGESRRTRSPGINAKTPAIATEQCNKAYVSCSDDQEIQKNVLEREHRGFRLGLFMGRVLLDVVRGYSKKVAVHVIEFTGHFAFIRIPVSLR
jgi:hypothetical protein